MALSPDTVVVAMVSSKQSWWCPLSSNAGLILTGAGLGFGVIQYWLAQRWKRAEFIAAEMKAFMGDPSVRRALTMIDWSTRRVDLFNYGDARRSLWVKVTRRMQCLALRPHPVANRAETEYASSTEDQSLEENALSEHGSDVESLVESLEEKPRGFTVNQAAIRDCYDALLDGLERFNSFIDTRLIGVEGLKPYLKYWIDDIAAPTQDSLDAAWTFGLLSYIDYYGFIGVQKLFAAFGHDIKPGSTLYEAFQKQGSADPMTAEIRAEVDRVIKERLDRVLLASSSGTTI